MLQTAEGLTAIILRLGGAGGGRKPASFRTKERREQIAREWANWETA